MTDPIAPTRTYRDGRNRIVRERAGVQTIIEQDDQVLRWATTPRISQDFLDHLGRQRNAAPRRAPLGESRGGWTKVAEIPVSYLMGKLPRDAWEDRKAFAKLINDRDLRAFRTDGDGRTY